MFLIYLLFISHCLGSGGLEPEGKAPDKDDRKESEFTLPLALPPFYLEMAFPQPLPSGELKANEYDYIVVIPDTHGDFEATVQAVFAARTELLHRIRGEEDYPRLGNYATKLKKFRENIILAIKDLNSGKGQPHVAALATRIALIQLGDVVDRGPYSKECIDLFEVLPNVLGWNIIKLYGNHDVWTLLGNPETERMIKLKDKEFLEGYINRHDVEAFVPLEVKNSHPKLTPRLVEEFNRDHRIPYFRRGGVYYKRYLNSYLGMARLMSGSDTRTNTLFVHAGVDLEWLFQFAFVQPEFEYWQETRKDGYVFGSRYAPMSNFGDIDKFNSALREFLLNEETTNEDKDEVLSVNADKSSDEEVKSFLWTRKISNAKRDDFITCLRVSALLSYFGVARIVVGHTPQEEWKVKTRCGGKFIILDVAMSHWMNGDIGRPTAMLMKLRDNGSIDKIETVAYFNGQIKSRILN